MPPPLVPTVMPLLLLLVLLPVSLCGGAGANEESPRYTIHLDMLPEVRERYLSRPMLISVESRSTFRLPAGAADNATVLDGSFDPLWYYVLRRRGVRTLEWSGCGGKWRDEWAVPLAAAAPDADGETLALAAEANALRHHLSQHVVCTHSSVSFCHPRWTPAPGPGESSKEFQWAAQFTSTLTSSPLSWMTSTARHNRPSGVLLPLTAAAGDRRDNRSRGDDKGWCSYHVVNHDTLCTQHVGAVLRGGRAEHEVREHFPDGIFRAVFDAPAVLFATHFHAFSFGAERAEDADSGDGSQLLTLTVRMTAVVSADPERAAPMLEHWRRALPPFAPRLRVAALRTAVPVAVLGALPVRPSAAADRLAAVSSAAAAAAAAAPSAVTYLLHTHGKDHGYYSVSLQQPPDALERRPPLSAGDEALTLLLFPLHSLRPALHTMESFGGATTLAGVKVDYDTNTLCVVLRTVLSAAHVARHTSGAPVLLARFFFTPGWIAVRELPRDANSNRILPQPIVRLSVSGGSGPSSSPTAAAAAAPPPPLLPISHHGALARIVADLMSSASTAARRGGGGNASNTTPSDSDSSHRSYYWLRATEARGYTIPASDPAMVFNFQALGLIFISLIVSAAARSLFRLLRTHPSPRPPSPEGSSSDADDEKGAK